MGQKIIAEKLEIFFLNTPLEMEEYICNELGYNKGTFPCKYLEIYLEKRVKKNQAWEIILERIDNHRKEWKGKWLTKAGRTKLKEFLSEICTYQSSCLQIPNNINKKNRSKTQRLLLERNKR